MLTHNTKTPHLALLENCTVDLTNNQAPLRTRIAESLRILIYPLCKPITKALLDRTAPQLVVNEEKTKSIKITVKGNKKERISAIVTMSTNKIDVPIKDRELRIHFLGNTDPVTDHEIELMQEKFPDSDHIIMEYPAHSSTKEATIRGGLAAIKRAKDLGYSTDNIYISGFSFGGLVTTEVINQAKTRGVLKEGEKFAHYANINSLNKSSSRIINNKSDMINNKTSKDPLSEINRIQQKFPGVKNWLTETAAKFILKLTGWEIDSANLIRKGLPVKTLV